LAHRFWLEAIQHAGFGLLYVSSHGLLGLGSVSMLQSLNNLHVLSECHKTRIEIQHSLHVLDELLDEISQPAVARGPSYQLMELNV
jgi:hypothetical protein